MYKYEVILYWSNEDNTFVAEVPELPGCMAHGATQEAALKQVQESHRAVDRYGARVRRSGTRTKG